MRRVQLPNNLKKKYESPRVEYNFKIEMFLLIEMLENVSTLIK